MPATLSPLRYPGGKTKLYHYVRSILESNGLLGETYIEPFAGGAGLALKLLLKGDVKRIVINDSDQSIYSFWYSILNWSEEFCEMIASTDITLAEWERQRQTYSEQNTTNMLQLGFATFFLNRTNVSGIIKGGLIGGLQQDGANLMDARFNKQGLMAKIQDIASHREQIFLCNLDAQSFLQPEYLGKFYKAFINFDPPYVRKGDQLYKNAFTEDDHRLLSQEIGRCRRKWIVTYDVCPLIGELYAAYRHSYLDVAYSLNNKTVAQEYIFFSNNLTIPDSIDVVPH